jgi:hypothetical protein
MKKVNKKKMVQENTILENNLDRDPMNATKIKRSQIFSGLSIFEYLRELSIVIIGVLITLFITNYISDRNKQKEIHGMLGFIKTELIENKENLEWIHWRWEGEQHIFGLVLENTDNLKEIPADTLKKYNYAIGALYSLSTKKESYELLKSSMLMQYVKDKNLLRKLSGMYGRLQNLDAQLSRYSTQKTSFFLEPVIAEMEENVLKKMTEEDVYVFWDYIAPKKEFRKFAYTSQTILSPSTIYDDCKAELQEVIQMLDKLDL